MKHNMHGTNNTEQHALKTEHGPYLNIGSDLRKKH